jgi:hypothetical protein
MSLVGIDKISGWLRDDVMSAGYLRKGGGYDGSNECVGCENGSRVDVVARGEVHDDRLEEQENAGRGKMSKGRSWIRFYRQLTRAGTTMRQ